MGERALRPRRWWVRFATAFVITLLQAGTTSATAGVAATLPESLQVAIDDCSVAAIGGGAAFEALATELESDGVRPSAGERASEAEGQLSVFMLCGASIESQVVLTRHATGKTATATLSLGDVPFDQRPRALALAASELVRGYWSVLVDRDATVDLRQRALPQTKEIPSRGMLPDIPSSSSRSFAVPAPTPTFAPPAASPKKQELIRAPIERARDSASDAAPPSQSWMGLEARGRAFLDRPTLFLGGGLDFGVGAWMFGVEGMAVEKQDPLGDVTSGLASLRTGWAFQLLFDPRWSWRLGPRGGVGLAWASASESPSARDAIGLYADLAARTELRLRSGHLQMTLSLEGGVARGLAALAGDRTVSASGGWFVGPGIGIRHDVPLVR